MAGSTVEVTDQSFDHEVIESKVPTLVDFWATWCGPCLALAPTVEELSHQYAGKVKFCKIDVDRNPSQAARFGVKSIPTLILFQAGKNLGQLVGNVPKAQVEELLKKA